jgi:hypothetical protein
MMGNEYCETLLQAVQNNKGNTPIDNNVIGVLVRDRIDLY